MSRSKTRARRRRRRFEDDLRTAVRQARTVDATAVKLGQTAPGHGELWQLMREIERSGCCVWQIARAIRCTEEEMAMIAQIVAPELAAMTPGMVLRRPGKVLHRRGSSRVNG